MNEPSRNVLYLGIASTFSLFFLSLNVSVIFPCIGMTCGEEGEPCFQNNVILTRELLRGSASGTIPGANNRDHRIK